MESHMKKHSSRSLVILITLSLALSLFGTSVAQRKTGSQAKKTQPQKADCRTDVDAETALAKGAVKYIIKSEFEPKQVANMVKEILAGYTRNQVPTTAT